MKVLALGMQKYNINTIGTHYRDSFIVEKKNIFTIHRVKRNKTANEL
jgi:hypothetical protein